MSNAPLPDDPAFSSAYILSRLDTWTQGRFLTSMVYGMGVLLFTQTFCLLLAKYQDKFQSTRRENIYLLVHISIVLLFSTLYVVGLLASTQITFVQDLGALFQNANWAQTMQYTAQIFLIWVCGVINLWRCATVYRGSRIPVWLASTIPSQIYIAMFAFGIFSLATLKDWKGFNPSDGLILMILAFAFNILLTLLIVGRLLFCRYRKQKSTLSGRCVPSVSLATIFVESGALAGIFSTISLIVFALGSGIVGEAIRQMLPMIQTISTLLIILRVAQGKGWRLQPPSETPEDVDSEASALRFEPETADRRNTIQGPPTYVAIVPEAPFNPLPTKMRPIDMAV